LAEEIPLATVAKKPGHRGEREVTVKTIARGMPGVSGVTVVTNSRVFSTREAAGASSARHSLRPLHEEGGIFKQNSRASRGEIAGSCRQLEQRHCEERSDEAIHSCFLVGLWIASLRSQ
jgi:hypothetical protein